MASERVQGRIDHLLDQTEEAGDRLDWERVHQLAQVVLDWDPDNKDAGQFIAAAERNLSLTSSIGAEEADSPTVADDDKIYCVYIALNEKMVREHARLCEFPANSIAKVRSIIDPTPAEV